MAEARHYFMTVCFYDGTLWHLHMVLWHGFWCCRHLPSLLVCETNALPGHKMPFLVCWINWHHFCCSEKHGFLRNWTLNISSHWFQASGVKFCPQTYFYHRLSSCQITKLYRQLCPKFFPCSFPVSPSAIFNQCTTAHRCAANTPYACHRSLRRAIN